MTPASVLTPMIYLEGSKPPSSTPARAHVRRAYPELSLELDFRDHHLDLIDAGMDLGIRNGPIGVVAGLQARRIAHHRSLICAAPSYVERYGMLGSLDMPVR